LAPNDAATGTTAQGGLGHTLPRVNPVRRARRKSQKHRAKRGPLINRPAPMVTRAGFLPYLRL